MAKRKNSVNTQENVMMNDFSREMAEFNRNIQESMDGLRGLANGVGHLNDNLREAAGLTEIIASGGRDMVSGFSAAAKAINEISAVKSGGGPAGLMSDAVSQAEQATQVMDSGLKKAAGESGSKFGEIFGGIAGGLGAAFSIAGSIVGIFKKRREEEKKYQREHLQALNAQLTAEVQLGLLTSSRLVTEQQITREKYKQIEKGIGNAGASRQDVLSDVDKSMDATRDKLDGRYSAAYKRTERDYLNALAALKNNAGDLDWLNSAGSNPLMNKSNDHYDEYMAYLNRLKAIAEQKEQWEQQQQQLVDKTIGSTADSLAQSWIEAFEKGEEATWDFAKNFEDVMRKAIVNGFSDSVILAQIDPIFKKFQERVSGYLSGEMELDDIITPELERQVEDTSEKIKKLSPELQKILEKLGLDVSNSSANTLSAAIKGVSEETASLVAGQMNAIRLNQSRSADQLAESLIALNRIEANTRYNRYLESIDRKMDAFSSGGSLKAAGLA